MTAPNTTTNDSGSMPPEYDGRASYSPEDNKLRLYVGRVPRDEYERLRAEGWTSTPKQDCDFVAHWTPQRRDTALEYAGLIDDEDQGPEDRAAERAERFGEYRDKRTDEATGDADRYDGQPAAHGFQSQVRADRAAARHDRIAAHACDAWSKAEYWQRRTAGVITHALHVSSPSVRMGRIKTLEAEQRKHLAAMVEWSQKFAGMVKLVAIEDPETQTKAALAFIGSTNIWAEYLHPRAATHLKEYRQTNKTSLYSLMTDSADPISGAEACALFFSNHSEPANDDDWSRHYALRLAYENQMLEAQGGRLASVEIEPGGKIGGKLVVKVNKSNVTGRVVSVSLKGPKVQGWTYRAANVPGTDYALYQFDTERMPMSAYAAPTDESRAELDALIAEKKAKAPTKTPRPLINPTDEDADRLQAIWNERAHDEHRASESYTQFEPAKVVRLTQAQYSAHSKGSYASCDTRGLCRDARLRRAESNLWTSAGAEYDKRVGASVCMIRRTSGGKSRGWAFDSVIVLTDKPQRNLPKEVWSAVASFNLTA